MPYLPPPGLVRLHLQALPDVKQTSLGARLGLQKQRGRVQRVRTGVLHGSQQSSHGASQTAPRPQRMRGMFRMAEVVHVAAFAEHKPECVWGGVRQRRGCEEG